MMDLAEETRTQLLIRTRELEAMNEVLLYVQHLEEPQKKQWMQLNGEEMALAFRQFMSVSEYTMRQQSMDAESMQLSYDLIKKLRETENLVQQLFGDQAILVS